MGACALVTEGNKFDDHMLILGTPAKAVRPLTPEEITRLRGIAENYATRAATYQTQLKKIG